MDMVAQHTEPHQLDRAVALIEAGLNQMSPDAWARLDGHEARALIGRLARAQARIDSQKLHAARRLEATGAARQAGATSTSALIANGFGGDTREANNLVKLAKSVKPSSPTQAALDAGEITPKKSEVIARTVASVPKDKQELAERGLVRDAKKLSLPELRKRADRVSDLWAEPTEVDQTENTTLEERERKARARSSFRMWNNHDGTWSGDFRVPEAQAGMLKTAVEALAAPRRDHLRDEADQAPRDHTQRMGIGFADLCEHLPTDRLPDAGGLGAIVTVNLGYSALLEDLKAASLSTGTKMSAGQARQLACRAGLIPQVLGGDSLPLDLGQTQRLFSRPQRQAFAHRDRGCSFPGCDRPPQWCEAHHITPFAKGGNTNRVDGTLVCSWHHHVIHEQNWQLRRSPADGIIEYKLPHHARWRRNERYRG
ncbi:MAG: DUF222 domain-containing protein [Aeromicrobium sp.]|uniref:HNH endonuclease signature motif containing protein n=1 Tax=Aeromicrobium sp. TaxID=1871063 RepID=UPI0039E5659B